jgi:triphosphoribosyl-dephospho-CoA synthetase
VARTIARDRGGPRGTAVPARTSRRWNARLESAARQIVHILAQHDDDQVAKFAGVAGFDATRRELVELFTAGRVLGAHALEDIASTLDALERGVRLM